VTAHLRLLAILQLVWGAMGLLLGVSTLLLALGAVAIGVSASGDRFAAGFTAAAFGIFAAALIAGGGANVWAGGAIRRRQPNGRLIVLSLGVLNLFVLPFGTALAIYAYWVLLHNETRMMFEPGIPGAGGPGTPNMQRA
jgi:hypothetical protein